MKTLVLLCFALIATCSCVAQTVDENTTIPKRYDPKQKWDATPPAADNINNQKALSIPQSTGKTYGNEQISQMARRDVNGIASTVGGVDSRPGTGEVPSIRGAGASGTAYFVDGVRVYGALPIITK